MTTALCLGCGETKFGALRSCPHCSRPATGDFGLDIAFSDHTFAVSTLEQFGEVIKEIGVHCDDPRRCFWAFLHFVSEHHPEILSVNIEGEGKADLDALLSECALPEVQVERSPTSRSAEDEE